MSSLAKTKNKNSINVIRPYLYNGVWVFDDASRGLNKEALIAGIPEIIVKVCIAHGIKNPQDGFLVVFSSKPFPGADVVLEHSRRHESGEGNWYKLKGTALEGWLCPALFKYFESAPKKIYIQVKSCAG